MVPTIATTGVVPEKRAVASLVAAIGHGLGLIVLERTGWEPNALVETCGPIGNAPSWIDRAGVAIRSANPGPTDNLRIDPARIGPIGMNALKQIALGVQGDPIELSLGMMALEIELTTGSSGEVRARNVLAAVNQGQVGQVRTDLVVRPVLNLPGHEPSNLARGVWATTGVVPAFRAASDQT